MLVMMTEQGKMPRYGNGSQFGFIVASVSLYSFPGDVASRAILEIPAETG